MRPAFGILIVISVSISIKTSGRKANFRFAVSAAPKAPDKQVDAPLDSATAKYEIPYISIDIDPVACAQDGLGAKIRKVIENKTTWNTYPQIFIGGEFIGGCTDLFDACKDGILAQQLQNKDIPINTEVKEAPYSFLPTGLHSR